MSEADWQAIWLTLRLATLVTLVLLLVATPLAWWLARTHSRWRIPVAALVALPLILPPTVLGFYLLLAMGPEGPLGRLTEWVGWGLLPFSFSGLVVASVIHSLPFMVQPLYTAFSALGRRPLEVAATLGAGPLDRFFTIVIPLARSGFLTGSILAFAHTVGEFGVVLMIGGSLPGETRVVSVQIYDYVESLDYAQAHRLAALMLAFAFAVFMAIYAWQPRQNRGAEHDRD